MADRTQKGLNSKYLTCDDHTTRKCPQHKTFGKGSPKFPIVENRCISGDLMPYISDNVDNFCDFSDMLLMLKLDKLNQEYENNLY